MKKFLYILITLLATSCVGGSVSKPMETAPVDSDSVPTIVNFADTTTATDTTLMSLSPQQVDSMVFRLTHHYSENFNFLVKADSLRLIPREGDLLTDTCTVRRGDIIAVAAIKTVPGDPIDSIWVKVASTQTTMGWLRERELLNGATPDDPISQMLDLMSSSRAIWMSAFVVIGIIGVLIGKKKKMEKRLLQNFFDELPSIYPSLFLLLVAIMASLYASVQNFVPEYWQEYYFHPTLNPLVLPPLMAALVTVMWLVIITFIAVIEETYRHFYFVPGITYLAKLIGAAMLVYLLISWTTLIHVGYLLLAVLAYLLLKICIKKVKS